MADMQTRPALSFENVSFSYPEETGGKQVLSGVSFELAAGDFAVLAGDTGSGKTTLLRLAKRELSPAGKLAGQVRLFGRPLSEFDARESACLAGMVLQSPENQIVCDTVWHELAFGLENLGTDPDEMRLRIAETCSYLGMERLFRSACDELSGGQRQLVALASVLAMRPRLLLLDEPVSMLDPVSADAFLALLDRARRELGITVLAVTHEPERMAPFANRFFELADGRVAELESAPKREAVVPGAAAPAQMGKAVVTVDDVWLRYGKDDAWVLRGFDLELREGEVRGVMGGNGSGKTSLLKAIASIIEPDRGSVRKEAGLSQAFLPQDPRELFACESVEQELAEWAPKGADIEAALARAGLAEARDRHPLDLSGGQQQLLALEKLLLTDPALLLLDEPTKGLDAAAKALVLERIAEAARGGCAVLIATHDPDLVRSVCTSVDLLFDGQSALSAPVERFFELSWVYGQARA